MRRRAPLVVTEKYEDAEAFLRALDPLDPRWHTERGWIFRGHADARWKLTPTVHRRGRWKERLHPGDFEILRTPQGRRFIPVIGEFSLLIAFAFAAERSGLPIPFFPHELSRYPLHFGQEDEWPRDDIIPLLSLAQHSGVPTRLLDWTRRVRVAAYFAAAEATKNPPDKRAEWLCVWALRRNAFDAMPQGHVIEAPRAGNANLHAQDGLFTFLRGAIVPGDLRDVFRQARDDDDDGRPLSPWWHGALRCVCLKSSEAGRLLRLLSYEHVTAASVFPGYGGAALAISEELRWDRPGAGPDREPTWDSYLGARPKRRQYHRRRRST